MEKWDHESLQARLQDCPSVFEDEIFHRLSNRKARKGDSFLACDSAFVQRVGGKNFTKKFPSIFQDTLGQVFKRSIASVWQNRVLIKRFSVAERFYVNTMFREQFQESKWRRLENHLSFLNNPLRKRSWVPKTSKAAVYVRVRYNNRPIFVYIYFISMLTHVENVVNKNWLQKLSHLLRLFSYRSNKTSKCGQTVCGSMWHTRLPRRHATSLLFLKSSEGEKRRFWDRPTATGCVPFCFLAQRFC